MIADRWRDIVAESYLSAGREKCLMLPLITVSHEDMPYLGLFQALKRWDYAGIGCHRLGAHVYISSTVELFNVQLPLADGGAGASDMDTDRDTVKSVIRSELVCRETKHYRFASWPNPISARFDPRLTGSTRNRLVISLLERMDRTSG